MIATNFYLVRYNGKEALYEAKFVYEFEIGTLHIIKILITAFQNTMISVKLVNYKIILSIFCYKQWNTVLRTLSSSQV